VATSMTERTFMELATHALGLDPRVAALLAMTRAGEASGRRSGHV
jgi:hypothetical protein